MSKIMKTRGYTKSDMLRSIEHDLKQINYTLPRDMKWAYKEGDKYFVFSYNVIEISQGEYDSIEG